MILVLGRSGQLARALREVAEEHAPGWQWVFLSRDEADFLNPEQVIDRLRKYEPEIIINAAAYTAVDLAEIEREKAFQINAGTVGRIAEFCADRSLPLVHYSTDYVFNGHGAEPFRETDSAEPQNVYGQSKLEGERRVAAVGGKHLILRTSWVYHHEGANFVKTMLRLGAERETLSVVCDQIGSPTYARDIAQATLHIARQALVPQFEQWGLYHLAGYGFTSWHGFAQKVFELGKELRFPMKVRTVLPIQTSEYPTAARRPLNSRLNQEKLMKTFGIRLPSWETSLKACLEKIRESD